MINSPTTAREREEKVNLKLLERGCGKWRGRHTDSINIFCMKYEIIYNIVMHSQSQFSALIYPQAEAHNDQKIYQPGQYPVTSPSLEDDRKEFYYSCLG